MAYDIALLQSASSRLFKFSTIISYLLPDTNWTAIRPLLSPTDDSIDEEGRVGLAPAATPDPVDTVDIIVEIISIYLDHSCPYDQFESVGREKLRATVARYVETGEMIEIIFPAFPCKSRSKEKVLGVLPDLAEEILLRRLEELAQSISDYYPAGAMIRIVSDGVVYQDIIGHSEYVVYRYSAELRRMISVLNLSHVAFVSAKWLFDPYSSATEETMTEEEYIACLPDMRSLFLAHEVPGYDLETELKNDVGTLTTYRGYIKFLEAELEGHPAMKTPDGKPLSRRAKKKVQSQIGRLMMEAGAKFSDIVSKRFPHAIRISCHAHGNAGPKYAFSMFPGHARSGSPWHNVILRKADGSYAVDRLCSFDPSMYEIVYRYERPYYLCEHSVKLDPAD